MQATNSTTAQRSLLEGPVRAPRNSNLSDEQYQTVSKLLHRIHQSGLRAYDDDLLTIVNRKLSFPVSLAQLRHARQQAGLAAFKGRLSFLQMAVVEQKCGRDPLQQLGAVNQDEVAQLRARVAGMDQALDHASEMLVAMAQQLRARS